MTTIGTNEFVRRQVASSEFSHFNGSWEELEILVAQCFENGVEGYREGVCLIPMPPQSVSLFRCGVIRLITETELSATYEARREGEAPYVHLRAKGEKAEAVTVEVVLYRRDVLAEGNEASTLANWEIVSINARDCQGLEPLTPLTMARNMSGGVGGTETVYTAEELVDSILYWSSRAMVSV